MTDQPGTDLKELQKLDNRIEEVRQRISGFDPRLQEAEEPALVLQSELGTTRSRLQELKLEERRLELATEEKRTRRKRLDERLGSVRNLREEAAVSAELEMVKRALQNDEQETLTLLDQLRKMEDRARDLEASYAEASEKVGPKRDELLAERAEAEKELEALRAERTRFVNSVNAAELKIYDAIRAGGRPTAVADLTDDGACGHCFGMVPLQLRNEIRHGHQLIRCESCGVILTAPSAAATTT
jgi:predicted  nucleic acid-binding Zn-ribbon protein